MKQVQLIIAAFFLSIVFSSAIAQSTVTTDSLPVQWQVTFKKTEANKIVISFRGAISKDWHVYAKDALEDLTGPTVEYEDTAIQPEPLVIVSPLLNIKDEVFENKEKQVMVDSVAFTQAIQFRNGMPAAIKLNIKYEAANGANFNPEEQSIKLLLDETASATARILINSIDIHHPKQNCGTQAVDNASKSLWGIFFIGFLGGLIALITPCVFPMIPLTVSFFTKRAQSRRKGIVNAFLYGFFIFLIYILLSLPFHFLDSINPEFLNNISTNEYVNLILFIIIIAFALSFFGLYEITLPASLSTGADSKAGVGNVLGIFFMALTLAIVSFSCTGPILGSLLAGSLSTNGGAMQLSMGMAGFGLALAMPFALLALFPNLVQSLPRSGGWLGTVKVTLGFLELALALKFLSQADLVKHWGILKREVFIGIWIVIGIASTLFLFGKLKIGHESRPAKLSLGRKIIATIFLLITLYLIPGVTNTSYANLKWISGFPPPLYYSIYQKESDCILGLRCAKDYETGLAMAKAENKPILLDFTGYACVNCRKMEETIWNDAEIFKLMHDQFIVVSLYVDDKKLLPAEKQFTYTTKEGTKKEIVTYGDLWATMQTENFANNSQPWYAILNTNEQLMNNPIGYTPDKTMYLKWLQCGLDASK